MNNVDTQKFTKSNTRIQKAIFLVNDKSLKDDSSLREKMIKCTKDNNFLIIRTINKKTKYDVDVFDELLDCINEIGQPITLLLEDYEYIYSHNLIYCAVIGTLVKTKLAKIIFYRNDINNNLSLYFPNTSKIKFFQIAKTHLWMLTAFKKK